MPVRQRAVESLRRIGRATPPGVRGPLGRATRRLRPGWGGPLVSVVLPVSDEETTRVGPCFDGLRGQVHRNLEVVVVPYARHQRVLRTVRRHADEDWRVRALRRPARDLASARDRGAECARGEFLLFASGGDDLPPGALTRLLESLAASGSPFAVGRMGRPDTATATTEAPYAAAHEVLARGTTLVDSPIAVTDLGLGNRLFRRTWWREAGLGFAQRRSAGRVALDAYARADRFDLLPEVTYVPTGRVGGTSVGTVPDLFAELDGWLDEHRDTWRAVEELGLGAVRDTWLWGVLDTAVQPFLDDTERATPEQWDRLRDHVEEMLASSGERAWESLRAESRVKLWLLRHDQRPELERYVAARWFEWGNRPTEVRDGRVLAHLPYFGDREVGVPDDCYEMREAETPLRAVLHSARWDGTTVEMAVLARVDFVHLDEAPEVRVELVPDDGGEPVEVPATPYVEPEATVLAEHRYQDYARGAVRARIDAAALADGSAPGGGPRAWSVRVHVATTGEARGLRRSGGITGLDSRGSAGMLEGPLHAPRAVAEGVRAELTGKEGAGVQLVLRPAPQVRLVEAQVRGRRVRGSLDPGGRDLTAVRATMAGGLAGRAPLRRQDHLLHFDLDLPPSWEGPEHLLWRLFATARDGASVAVAWPDSDEQFLAVGQGEVVLHRSPLGECDLLEAADTLVLDEVSLRSDHVWARLHWLGLPSADARLELEAHSGRSRHAAAVRTLEDGALEAAIPTTWDEWGLGTTPIPIDRYWFRVHSESGRTGRVLHSDRMLGRLQQQTVGRHFRFRAIRFGMEAGVFLMKPLADDERGPYWQRRMQLECLFSEAPLDDSAVYLQSYDGATATDSQLAIHHELRRRHPELTPYWGVWDHSSRVPEGGVPVLMHSRRWFELMATARHLCLNIDFDRWFTKRPGQRVLQTFHGYPAKSMGIRMWEAKRYTPNRIELELARTSGDWTLITTPAPEMDVHYRREYRYNGEIHSAGYPRDDALLADDAERCRVETRERLGIRPDQTVVLYAPTWRDDLASRWRSAELVHHLDLEAASAALGPEYVILMRGHRFHGASQPAAGAARWIDVTTYPEVNDLILASDAAVLDYSSMRFDFALTGRPMVFLVPDLADYTGGVRGFLFDFRDTAPGPLVDTADEVVAHLRDLSRLRDAYAEEYARFNATYNYLQDGHAAERVVKAFWG